LPAGLDFDRFRTVRAISDAGNRTIRPQTTTISIISTPYPAKLIAAKAESRYPQAVGCHPYRLDELDHLVLPRLDAVI
jgi:hypothetical protein